MTLADPSSTVRTEPDLAQPVATAPVLSPPRPRRRLDLPRIGELALLAVAFGALAVSIALRFAGPKALWLDEALTVNIARLPIARLFDALRHDGSPPAYYVALHYWMGLFGTGTWTVRALAGTFSVLTLPVSWRLGRAVGGRRVAIALVVVTACNPFALRYGTENRMYSLVMLLVTLAALALLRTLQRPTFLRLVGLGLVCGLLLLTHYWALYLIAGLGTCLVIASLWGPVKGNARLATAAVAGGCLLFVPWLPSFLFQAQHTGTPWAASPSPTGIIDVLGEFAGYEQHTGIAVFVLFWTSFAILAAAVILPAIPATRRVATLLGWKRPVPGARLAGPTAGVFLTTLIFAQVGGLLAHAAFAWRYASVVMPFAMLLLALGVVAVGSTRLGRMATAAALAALGVLGVMAGAQEVFAPRTQAAAIATQIASEARPGDVVAYCPDQLGPAVSRLLPDRLLTQVTFPRFDDPDRINWVDYARVNEAANPGVFARQVLNLAGPHQVWLVWAPGYRTFGRDCQDIRDALELARTAYVQAVQSHPGKYYEPANLIRFAPD